MRNNAHAIIVDTVDVASRSDAGYVAGSMVSIERQAWDVTKQVSAGHHIKSRRAKQTDVAGETAALNAMLRGEPQYRLEYAVKPDHGAGIDQLRKKKLKHGVWHTTYLIAEAKGPGQGLARNQMSNARAKDRIGELSRSGNARQRAMGRKVAAGIGTKFHYAYHRIKVKGRAATARWDNPSGTLHHTWKKIDALQLLTEHDAMRGRVIQGFFPGGARLAPPTRLAGAPLRRPTIGPAAPGRPPLVHAAATAPVQRQAAPATSPVRPLQRFGGDSSFPVDPAQVGLVRNGGKPLPGALLAKMEAAFGADFSAVRVHVGPQASRIGALAFTTGNDLYFASGQYQPDSIKGQQLIGHELAHVIQQRQGRVHAPRDGVAVVQDRALEAEADRMGARAAAVTLASTGGPSRTTGSTRVAPRRAIQRMHSGPEDDFAMHGTNPGTVPQDIKTITSNVGAGIKDFYINFSRGTKRLKQWSGYDGEVAQQEVTDLHKRYKEFLPKLIHNPSKYYNTSKSIISKYYDELDEKEAKGEFGKQLILHEGSRSAGTLLAGVTTFGAVATYPTRIIVKKMFGSFEDAVFGKAKQFFAKQMTKRIVVLPAISTVAMPIQILGSIESNKIDAEEIKANHPILFAELADHDLDLISTPILTLLNAIDRERSKKETK